MDPIKIKNFVDIYCDTIKVDSKIRNILLELMQRIVLKYEKIIPYVPVEIDSSKLYLIKPKNRNYSIEDFFLNRLMRNVSIVTEINCKNNGDICENGTKGFFDPINQEVAFDFKEIDKQLDFNRNFLEKNFKEMKFITQKKVLMHEFEHALQTTYNDNLEKNIKDKYKILSDNIQKKSPYSIFCRKYKELVFEDNDPNYLTCGCCYNYNAYGDIKYEFEKLKVFNETLNESECLEMAGQTHNFMVYFKNSSYYLNIKNLESSNSYITNYGFLFKDILGRVNSFRIMYTDPLSMFEKFNSRYNKIFQTVYNSDKDAISILINSLYKIKNTNSFDEHLLISNALTLCLEKNIKDFYNSPEVSNSDMLASVNLFKQSMIKNDSNNIINELYHIKKLDTLKTIVSNRNQYYKNNQYKK